MNTHWIFWVARSIFAFFIFLLWASVASATLVSASFTASATGPFAGGDTFSVTVSLGEPVSFNSLDAVLSWDSSYLVPIDQVSSNHFLTLGSVFTGTGFEAATYDTLQGDTSITINLVSIGDPTERASSSSSSSSSVDLFTLTFQALMGVLPPTTIIHFDSLGAPSAAGAGLALYQIYDIDGGLIDPEQEPWVATPLPLEIALSNPVQPVPEPGLIELLVLGGLLMSRFVVSGRLSQTRV